MATKKVYDRTRKNQYIYRRLFSKATKRFATYGKGPNHCAVAIKDRNGRWTLDIEEGDFQTVKELYKNQERSDQTIKVFKLD